MRASHNLSSSAHNVANLVPLGIVADDLTGALDAAGPFAARGWNTWLRLRGLDGDESDAAILAVSTESRLLSGGMAVQRTVTATRRLGMRHCFKKIDSLLRGPLAAEIAAVVAERQPMLTILAPAIPALGRTTLNGIQLLHGRPVHQGTTDPFSLVTTANLLTQLTAAGCHCVSTPLKTVRAGAAALAAALHAVPNQGVAVLDAEEQSDLDLLACTGLQLEGDVVWCGSAGLGQALAGCLPQGPLLQCPRVSRVLVVCGSLHPQAQTQCAHVGAQPNVATLVLELTRADAVDLAAAVRRSWEYVQVVVLCTPSTAVTADGRAVLLHLLADLAAHLRQAPSFGVIATGGDTAAALCRGMQRDALQVLGLVEDGIPICIAQGGPSTQDRTPLITKAGSFGDDGSLWRATQAILERKEP
jgi:uncharacterized protein YgbK (DUF1537 family)